MGGGWMEECCLVYGALWGFLSQKTPDFLSIFNIIIIMSLLLSVVCSWALPWLLTLRNHHMLLVIPLPCPASWAPLTGTIHPMSCPSAPAQSLGWGLIHGTILCLGVCSRGVTVKTVIRLVFWEPWHPPPPPLCPTHVSTSSSLWKAARASRAALPVGLGWLCVCWLGFGIWAGRWLWS